MDFGWLKQVMPRGLYGRAAMILFLPVVVVSLVTTVVFVQRQFEQTTVQMTSGMARELALVSVRVRASPDMATAQVAGDAVAQPLGITLDVGNLGPAEDQRAIWDISGRYVMAGLRAAVPGVTAIDLGEPGTVTVGFDGGRPFSLTFERRRVSASNPHQLLVLLVFTALAMSGISAIFLRNQLRPIRRLARAAEAYGRGQVVAFRPAGAVEIRSAGTAFLDMRNRIERQNEQRKLMLSGISHDLRTPLTRLRLGLSMLSPDLPPDRDDIAGMDRDITEMGALIDAFLTHVRQGASDEAASTVAALPFVREVLADARRAGQHVTLVGFEGDGDTPVTLRANEIRRALHNLIGNATRHGRRVELDAAIGPRSFRISVEDDGPGIPADQREAAMRPFVRLDPARNLDHGEGAGLGLAIAADIARGHGGMLRLTDGERLGGLRAELVLPR